MLCIISSFESDASQVRMDTASKVGLSKTDQCSDLNTHKRIYTVQETDIFETGFDLGIDLGIEHAP